MQKITFVTGKGGVGKSVVAASLALRKAQQGKSVLLVELGDQSFYADFFNLPNVGYDPINLRENIDLSLWSGATCLREYALHLIKVESLMKLFFENKIMRTFINIAPALPELAIVGKITSGHRQVGPPMHYDEIIVDTYATGHFLALLRAPRGMAEAIKFGPMGDQTRKIQAVLLNPEYTSIELVTLPEELPIVEAQELNEQITKEFGFMPRLWINKCFGKSLAAGLKNQCADVSLEKWKRYLETRTQLEKVASERVGSPTANYIPLIAKINSWEIIEEMAQQMGSV
jgi:anion-transporting  ArsA/GET3 family ATPase